MDDLDLRQFKGRLRRHCPLAGLTSWRVGGAAELLAEPADMADLLLLLDIVRRTGVSLHVLGNGSNVLIDDEGLPGITLKLGAGFQSLEFDENTARVGAALPIPRLCDRLAASGYAGLHHLAGIPGTVGAAVVINAGAGGRDMASALSAVTYVDRHLNVVTRPAQELSFSYRSSALQGSGVIVTEAQLAPGERQDRDEIYREMKSILRARKEKFPLGYPNAGSVFKNPGEGLFAGRLIEGAGLKGFRIGDAQVSERHANFIINLGRATARDIRAVMEVIVRKVLDAHGVALQPEIVFLPQRSNR